MLNLSRHLVVDAFIVFVIFTTAYAQSSADRPRNEIEIRGEVGVPSGEANFSGTGASGSTIDFSKDFNFKNKLGFDLRYNYRTQNQKHKFVGQYSRDDWDQTATLSRSFIFQGQTYVANAQVSLDVTVRTFRGMYSYRWGNEKFRIGPMGDMGVISTRAKLSGTTTNGTRSTEGSISRFAATIGYDLDYDPTSKVNIFHNLGAIAFQGEHLFHTEGGIKLFVAGNFGVLGGYRAVRYKLEDGNNFITFRTHGPFFGGVFRF